MAGRDALSPILKGIMLMSIPLEGGNATRFSFTKPVDFHAARSCGRYTRSTGCRTTVRSWAVASLITSATKQFPSSS
eukprot:Skav223920  [mRNA]  locus=scaffold2593:279980:280210:- [translate_table: standard]